VAQGFNQVPGRDFDETWAPVPSAATTRALFAVAAAKNWEFHHVDVKSAFLNENMDKEMYIKLPVGAEPGEEDDVRRLNLALYGTKQAGRLWGIKLNKELNAIGAVRSKGGPVPLHVKPHCARACLRPRLRGRSHCGWKKPRRGPDGQGLGVGVFRCARHG